MIVSVVYRASPFADAEGWTEAGSAGCIRRSETVSKVMPSGWSPAGGMSFASTFEPGVCDPEDSTTVQEETQCMLYIVESGLASVVHTIGNVCISGSEIM